MVLYWRSGLVCYEFWIGSWNDGEIRRKSEESNWWGLQGEVSLSERLCEICQRKVMINEWKIMKIKISKSQNLVFSEL